VSNGVMRAKAKSIAIKSLILSACIAIPSLRSEVVDRVDLMIQLQEDANQVVPNAIADLGNRLISGSVKQAISSREFIIPLEKISSLRESIQKAQRGLSAEAGMKFAVRIPAVEFDFTKVHSLEYVREDHLNADTGKSEKAYRVHFKVDDVGVGVSDVQVGIQRQSGEFQPFLGDDGEPVASGFGRAVAPTTEVELLVTPGAGNQLHFSDFRVRTKPEINIDIQSKNGTEVEIPIIGVPFSHVIDSAEIENQIENELEKFILDEEQVAKVLSEKVVDEVNSSVQTAIDKFYKVYPISFLRSNESLLVDLDMFNAWAKRQSVEQSELRSSPAKDDFRSEMLRDVDAIQSAIDKDLSILMEEGQNVFLSGHALLDALMTSHPDAFDPSDREKMNKIRACLPLINQNQLSHKALLDNGKKQGCKQVRKDIAKLFESKLADIENGKIKLNEFDEAWFEAWKEVQKKRFIGMGFTIDPEESNFADGQVSFQTVIDQVSNIENGFRSDLSPSQECPSVAVRVDMDTQTVIDMNRHHVDLDLKQINLMLIKLHNAGYLDYMFGGAGSLREAPQIEIVDPATNTIRIVAQIYRDEPTVFEKVINGVRQVVTLSPGTDYNEYTVHADFRLHVEDGKLRARSKISSIREQVGDRLWNKINLIDLVFRLTIKQPLKLPAYMVSDQQLTQVVDDGQDMVYEFLSDYNLNFINMKTDESGVRLDYQISEEGSSKSNREAASE